MKQVLALFIIAAVIFMSCGGAKRVGPFDDGKAVCREKADTVIAHMKGWKEMSSYYNEDMYMTSTDRQTGEHTEFYRYMLIVTVSDGRDTLMVMTDDSTVGDSWDGRIHGRDILFSDDANVIKRHNLALKRVCEGDKFFIISVNDSHVLSAKFEKQKLKESERPVEDYGLTEEDIR